MKLRSSYIITFALILAFWMVVCLLDSTWYYFTVLHKGKPLSYQRIVAINVPYWILAAMMTPPVAWVSRRVSFARGRRLRAMGTHLICVIPFAIIHVLLFRIIRYVQDGAPLYIEKFPYMVRSDLAATLDKEMLLYAVMVIGVSAYDYYRRFQEKERAAAALELEQARLRASLSSAQLDALKMQLQPHFLFNSLHAISTLIMRGDSQAANQMLLHLSQFLRMTLDNTDAQEVPLAVELEFLDAYLRIQRERFGERLEIEIDVEEEALPASVPNLVLQPLVENAIRHGIGADPGRGRIAVKARRANGRLEICVQDNGNGLPEDGSHTEGMGLRNIRARLEQLYPGAYSLTLAGAPSGGTAATITMPFRVIGKGD